MRPEIIVIDCSTGIETIREMDDAVLVFKLISLERNATKTE